jgi:RNA polymerase sigma factor (sigma-70 family)
MRNISADIENWKRRLAAADRFFDPTLLVEARKGNKKSALLLVKRYEHRVARIIESRLGNARIRDKEDILQDALATMYGKVSTGGFTWTSENAFFRWIVLTVTGTIESQLASQPRHDAPYIDERGTVVDPSSAADVYEGMVVYDNSTDTPGNQMIDSEVKSMLSSALKHLDGTDRSIVELIMNGASYALVAKKIKMSPSRVKQRYFTGLRRIRKILERVEGHPF